MNNPNPPVPIDPRDALSQDELLVIWSKLQSQIATLKAQELEFRRYVVSRAFPQAVEGTNVQELGNGYSLKAKIKYNYNLKDNDTVWAGLEELSKLNNEGPFIAERLVSWSPNFLLTEYRKIEDEAANGSEIAKKQLFVISKFMERKNATPELEIKAPKEGKK